MKQIHLQQHPQRQHVQPIKSKYLPDYEKEREQRREDELRDKERFERELRDKDREKLSREMMPMIHPAADRDLEKQRMFQLKQEDLERIKFKPSENDPEW